VCLLYLEECEMKRLIYNGTKTIDQDLSEKKLFPLRSFISVKLKFNGLKSSIGKRKKVKKSQTQTST
jgi:hypothetical protein